MSARKRVLMAFEDEVYGVCKLFIDEVEKHFDIVWLEDFEKDPKKYEDIVGILPWRMKQVPERWVKSLPNLEVVANVGVGYDALDVPMIRSYGVKVSNTPEVLSPATADLGMTLLLAAGRNLINYVSNCRSPEFVKLQINDMSLEVSGTCLGIVGMGRIGYLLAKRAAAFDMKILYHNRTQRPAAEEATVGATFYSSLNQMLPHCDYVVVVVCLTDETKKIIGAEQFKAMKKSAVFVNISRGTTVDQDALVEALKSGEIHSAALDVTYPEPLPKDHDLMHLPNVFITPHVGSQTVSTRLKMIQLALDNIIAGVNGTKLPTEVFK